LLQVVDPEIAANLPWVQAVQEDALYSEEMVPVLHAVQE
jgi:hypothetical protein